MRDESYEIFVTVGFSRLDFSRLIKKMDSIAPNLNANVTMQIGHTTYEPINADFFRFAPSLQPYISKADVIVSHGGATIIEILQCAKPVVVCPRLYRYNEIINDHQVEFSQMLSDNPLVRIVSDVESLQDAILKSLNKSGSVFEESPHKKRLIGTLKKVIEDNKING